MSVEYTLATAFGGSLLAYIFGKISPRLRDTFAVFISLILVIMVISLYSKIGKVSVYYHFLGLELILGVSILSWFFALAISFLGALSVIFSLSYMKDRERVDFYYLMLLLVNASMLGIVFSSDLISFFVFWEIMSWSTFLLISYNRGTALAAGMKYIVMSVAGSMAMLVGIISLYQTQNTLVLSKLAENINMSGISGGYKIFILVLFFIAFGIKNALIPFHPWLPPAHSEAPSPFSAILSGILIKMGTYGFILLFYVIIGYQAFLQMQTFRFILNILAAITILIPTFIALSQDDAKRLLAWSTVAQAGYIILGLAFGTHLGVTGGVFHLINHASFKALLFLAVGAVEFRTHGMRDLNSLGGLIKKMPLTFTAVLIGTCGLIGIPLTNGFVSKWILYKTLILNGSPFLAFAALFGTWGTILYGYKLIHHIFLGQLPERYKDIKKAPFSMQLPMIILSMVVLLFGIFPGIPLKCINTIGTSLGLESLHINLWGIVSQTGTLNTINLFAAVLIGCTVGWFLLKMGPKSVSVSQEDTYAAGSAIPRDKYHYTVDFYNPIIQMLKPCLKDFVDLFYSKLVGWTQNLCSNLRRIYSGYMGHYVMYIVLFLAVLIFVQLKWRLW
jgi:NADH-quinone oxidoreductase subunit M